MTVELACSWLGRWGSQATCRWEGNGSHGCTSGLIQLMESAFPCGPGMTKCSMDGVCSAPKWSSEQMDLG